MAYFKYFFVTLFLLSAPLHAAEKTNKEEEPVKIKEVKKEVTPVTEWIDAENKLTETLPQTNKAVLYILRHKHSVIRTINIVHGEINNAVIACGKENPDFKNEISSRFKDWEKAVLPIVKSAKKELKREIKEQDAVHASDVNHILDLNDKAYKYTNDKIVKTPVSKLDSCKRLLLSMDRTENELVKLLEETLLPIEVIRSRDRRYKDQLESEKKDEKAKKEEIKQ